MNKAFMLICIILLAAVSIALAQNEPVPTQINYQGRLIDAEGNGINGQRDFQFRIYNVPYAGDSVWGPQLEPNVNVVNGIYNVVLGDIEGDSLAAALSGGDCYLGIAAVEVGQSFENVPEITPRQQILSAPYAFNALNATRPVGARDENLAIRNNPAAPDHQIQIWFDYLTLYDDNGFIFVKSVPADSPKIVDIEQTGPGGRDTVDELNPNWHSKWCYIWMIFNPETSDLKGLLSLSSKNPAVPDGYAAKRRVGAIFNQQDGKFRLISQLDKQVVSERIQLDLTSSSEFQEINLEGLIPETATKIYGTMIETGGCQHIVASEPNPLEDPDRWGLGYLRQGKSPVGEHHFPYEMAVTTPQKIFNRREGCWTPSDNHWITVTGWQY